MFISGVLTCDVFARSNLHKNVCGHFPGFLHSTFSAHCPACTAVESMSAFKRLQSFSRIRLATDHCFALLVVVFQSRQFPIDNERLFPIDNESRVKVALEDSSTTFNCSFNCGFNCCFNCCICSVSPFLGPSVNIWGQPPSGGLAPHTPQTALGRAANLHDILADRKKKQSQVSGFPFSQQNHTAKLGKIKDPKLIH